jgi:hypothetical protein
MTVHSVTWPAAVTGRSPLARVRRLSGTTGSTDLAI